MKLEQYNVKYITSKSFLDSSPLKLFNLIKKKKICNEAELINPAIGFIKLPLV